MKKKNLFGLLFITMCSVNALAGGLLANTNQHIAWMRMMARGASNEIDAVFTNPAGTAFMDHDGWTLSLNIQSAYQTRDVLATFPLFTTPDHTVKYEGDAAAPIVPSLYAVYKTPKWAISGFLGVTGGGGKCSFDNGLPMFDAAVMAQVYGKSKALISAYPALGSVFTSPITPDQYTINTSMCGRQFVYGGQIGMSYKFTDDFSGYLGGRMNYFYGNYSGYVEVSAKPELAAKLNTVGAAVATTMPAVSQQLIAMAGENGIADIALDCDQTGWGLTPIIGLNYKLGRLTLATKYEFKTNLSIENDTKELRPTGSPELADFEHGVNTPADLPAVLYVAAGYEFIPNRLRGAIEYHFFDDKHAEMAGDKQKALKHGTHEVLAGVEWDINDMFTVSAGFQNTDYGLTDAYQTHTSFSCDSYSVGFGGAVNLSERVKVNVGYFWTTYKDYTKNVPAGDPGYCNTTMAGTDVYSRTNKVFGMGIDYKF